MKNPTLMLKVLANLSVQSHASAAGKTYITFSRKLPSLLGYILLKYGV